MTRGLEIAFVLWDGTVFGGAETATIALASQMAAEGDAPSVVFVGECGLYRPLLDRAGVPHGSLGLSRGSHVLRHSKRFAELVSMRGRDAAVLMSSGYMARALRMGGYRMPIVAVEHGGLLQFEARRRREKLRDIVDRTMGLGAVDAQVAVSHFLHERLLSVPHAPRTEVIHNGIDVASFASAADAIRRAPRGGSAPVIGVAGKLVQGKGLPDLLDALGMIGDESQWWLRVAGEGPLEQELRAQARRLGIVDRVEFEGWVNDMRAFWAVCDIGVAASNGLVESFGMTVVEALASGIPVVVSRSGGLTEVLGESGAGASFAPGDVDALCRLLRQYLGEEDLRVRSGRSARERAREFSIEHTAEKYRALLQDLLAERVG